MGDPAFGTQLHEKPPEDQLDSWKEIAAYLGRDVTTVQRWEKCEAMPVHRHVHDKRSSVYALTSELDAWRQSRKPRLDENNQPEVHDEPASPAATSPEPISRSGSPLGLRRWLAGAATVAIALVVTVAYVMRRGHTVVVARPKISSLAVLPLKNMTGDPSQEYLADGMTDALIGRLSSIHDLRVISRTSVMRFKNPQISVPEIAKTLNVDAIVEGSLMRDGNRIRVTAQMIRASTDEHFWSQTYDRELRDVFTVESELAQSIAQKVEATATGAEHERLAAVRPVAPEVYESYSRGEFALNKSSSKAELEASIPYFEDAIERDPGFAPAYVGLANAYSNLGTVFIGGSAEETRPKVVSAAEKALELDPNLAEALVLLASTKQKQWHWADAEADYRRALELDPNSAAAYEGLGLWLACQGRADEAVASAERGRELTHLGFPSRTSGGHCFRLATTTKPSESCAPQWRHGRMTLAP